MFVKHIKYCNALKSEQPCLPLAELEGKVSAARLTDEVSSNCGDSRNIVIRSACIGFLRSCRSGYRKKRIGTT